MGEKRSNVPSFDCEYYFRSNDDAYWNGSLDAVKFSHESDSITSPEEVSFSKVNVRHEIAVLMYDDCREPKNTIDTEYKTIARNHHWRIPQVKRTRMNYVLSNKNRDDRTKSIKSLNTKILHPPIGTPDVTSFGGAKTHRAVVSLTEDDINRLSLGDVSDDDDLAGLAFISENNVSV